MARITIWALPSPKLTSTSGAYTLARRLPNRLRTAAVAITTLLPSGSAFPDCSTSRRPAGIPLPCSLLGSPGRRLAASRRGGAKRAVTGLATPGRPVPVQGDRYRGRTEHDGDQDDRDDPAPAGAGQPALRPQAKGRGQNLGPGRQFGCTNRGRRPAGRYRWLGGPGRYDCVAGDRCVAGLIREFAAGGLVLGGGRLHDHL